VAQQADAQASGTVKVMVPCGMVLPIKAVIDEFKSQNPGVEIDMVLDNAVVLANRIIEKGESADVFISPGEQQMRLLEDEDLIADDSKKAFARLTLVCAVNVNNPAGIETADDLLEAETISCPDPSVNSSGLYAKRALTELGLWEKLQPNMVLTDHAIESHHFVAEGKADAGFMYLRCPLKTSDDKVPQSKVRLAFEFERDSYAPARAVAAAVKNAEEPELARKFVDFLASERGLELLEEKGLDPVPLAETEQAEARVNVVAFYPDNEGHQNIKDLLAAIEEQFGAEVSTEFVDFQSDEGFDRWQEAGLTCGAILVNGERNVTVTEGGEERDVSFTMGPGTYWEEDDLKLAVEQMLDGDGGEA
jgi:molybdate transport system substrate-binding protein